MGLFSFGDEVLGKEIVFRKQYLNKIVYTMLRIKKGEQIDWAEFQKMIQEGTYTPDEKDDMKDDLKILKSDWVVMKNYAGKWGVHCGEIVNGLMNKFCYTLGDDDFIDNYEYLLSRNARVFVELEKAGAATKMEGDDYQVLKDRYIPYINDNKNVQLSTVAAQYQFDQNAGMPYMYQQTPEQQVLYGQQNVIPTASLDSLVSQSTAEEIPMTLVQLKAHAEAINSFYRQIFGVSYAGWDNDMAAINDYTKGVTSMDAPRLEQAAFIALTTGVRRMLELLKSEGQTLERLLPELEYYDVHKFRVVLQSTLIEDKEKALASQPGDPQMVELTIHQLYNAYRTMAICERGEETITILGTGFEDAYKNFKSHIADGDGEKLEQQLGLQIIRRGHDLFSRLKEVGDMTFLSVCDDAKYYDEETYTIKLHSVVQEEIDKAGESLFNKAPWELPEKQINTQRIMGVIRTLKHFTFTDDEDYENDFNVITASYNAVFDNVEDQGAAQLEVLLQNQLIEFAHKSYEKCQYISDAIKNDDDVKYFDKKKYKIVPIKCVQKLRKQLEAKRQQQVVEPIVPPNTNNAVFEQNPQIDVELAQQEIDSARQQIGIQPSTNADTDGYQLQSSGNIAHEMVTQKQGKELYEALKSITGYVQLDATLDQHVLSMSRKLEKVLENNNNIAHYCDATNYLKYRSNASLLFSALDNSRVKQRMIQYRDYNTLSELFNTNPINNQENEPIMVPVPQGEEKRQILIPDIGMPNGELPWAEIINWNRAYFNKYNIDIKSNPNMLEHEMTCVSLLADLMYEANKSPNDASLRNSIYNLIKDHYSEAEQRDMKSVFGYPADKDILPV